MATDYNTWDPSTAPTPGSSSNQTWTTSKGRTTNNYAEFLRWQAEDGAGGGSGNSDLVDTYSNLWDKQLKNTKDLMGLTHEFRQKEGATQGQMDAQSFKRLGAELETRKYMQSKGQDLTNWQRDKDANRATTALKTFGR